MTCCSGATDKTRPPGAGWIPRPGALLIYCRSIQRLKRLEKPELVEVISIRRQRLLVGDGAIRAAVASDLNNQLRTLVPEKWGVEYLGKFHQPELVVMAVAGPDHGVCSRGRASACNAKALPVAVADLLIVPMGIAAVPVLVRRRVAGVHLRGRVTPARAKAKAGVPILEAPSPCRETGGRAEHVHGGRVSRGRRDRGCQAEREQARGRQGRHQPSAGGCTSGGARPFFAQSHLLSSLFRPVLCRLSPSRFSLSLAASWTSSEQRDWQCASPSADRLACFASQQPSARSRKAAIADDIIIHIDRRPTG